METNTVGTEQNTTKPAPAANPAKPAADGNAKLIRRNEKKGLALQNMQRLLSPENMESLADSILRVNEASSRTGDYFRKHGTPVAGASFKGALPKGKRVTTFSGYELSEAAWKDAPTLVKQDVKILSSFVEFFSAARIPQTIVK